MQGDGDVFRRKNQQAFRKYVMKQTNGKGVHFMMADGVRPVPVPRTCPVYVACLIVQARDMRCQR